MDFLRQLFSSEGFMPHGHCYLWLPQLVWLHVISDGLTAIAYTSIPFTLLYFVRKRKDVPFNWMFVAFGAFIIACGGTHAMEIYTLWTPAYWLSGAIKAVTAVASVTTAVLLIRLMPQALAIPRPDDLLAARRDVVKERQNADEQRLLLAAIVDSSSDAIIGQDLDGHVTSWNEGAFVTFGYRAEEALGKTLAFLIPPGEDEHMSDIVARLKRGERVPAIDATRRRKDGRDVIVSAVVSPVRDATGTITGMSVTARDITEQRKGEAALVQAKEDALAANRDLEAFSASVAHDLRGPLRAINGFSTALVEDHSDALNADAKAQLARISVGAERMGHLIDTLLDLARLTRAEVNLTTVDLSEMAKTIAASLQGDEPARKVTFALEENLSARADPELLHIMLENLLGNAWKFTARRPLATIQLGHLIDAQGEEVFFVRDNGAGFDMALSEKLFLPFRRLHRTGDFDGTGIGLATVERIVRRHGGKIWAESVEGEGATFYFTLPAAHEAAS